MCIKPKYSENLYLKHDWFFQAKQINLEGIRKKSQKSRKIDSVKKHLHYVSTWFIKKESLAQVLLFSLRPIP